MEETFLRSLEHARRVGGRWGVTLRWAKELVDLARTGVRLRMPGRGSLRDAGSDVDSGHKGRGHGAHAGRVGTGWMG